MTQSVKKVTRLSAMWYVLTPQDLLASHPITRKAAESEEPGKAATSASSFARLAGLPSNAGQSAEASSSATLTTTDGAEVLKSQVYSPFPVGGFFSLETEDAVCDLILQWFEDSEVLRRRNANLVTVGSPQSDSTTDVTAAATSQTPTKKTKFSQVIQVQFPTVVEYDDVDVLNYVEMNLNNIVIMEPKGQLQQQPQPTVVERNVDGGDAQQQQAEEADDEHAKAALIAAPSPFAQNDDQPYTFHGQRWVSGALLRYFQRQAALAEH